MISAPPPMMGAARLPDEPSSHHPPLKVRGVRFAGYAAIFGRPDSGGDVVREGAFAASLTERRSVPLLWQHQAGAVIGRVEHLSEDQRGLRVIASISNAQAAALVGSGKLQGLSFGYCVREAAADGAYRELKAVDLIEVSLVARPSQRLARVHAVDFTQRREAAKEG